MAPLAPVPPRAPRLTVRRTKPRPSGSHDKLRLPGAAWACATPLTRPVSGATLPLTPAQADPDLSPGAFQGDTVGWEQDPHRIVASHPRARPSKLLQGRWTSCGRRDQGAPGGGGRQRANASSRIGAAALRPTSPGPARRLAGPPQSPGSLNRRNRPPRRSRRLVAVLKAIRPPPAFSGGDVPSRMLPTCQAATGSSSRDGSPDPRSQRLQTAIAVPNRARAAAYSLVRSTSLIPIPPRPMARPGVWPLGQDQRPSRSGVWRAALAQPQRGRPLGAGGRGGVWRAGALLPERSRHAAAWQA
jgi:hypothetical protein